jgi:glycine cleavage system H protein
MTVPEQLRYTAEHEWVTIDGSLATVGITEHAADALGDVVYVSPPAPGTKVTAGEPCGEIESTKSVSDLYSPVDGEVNADPYGSGWLFKVQIAGDEPTDLLSAEEYTALISEDG